MINTNFFIAEGLNNNIYGVQRVLLTDCSILLIVLFLFGLVSLD